MDFHFVRDGAEMVARKSAAVPKTISILITGVSVHSVTSMIEEVMQYSTDCFFMSPIECPAGGWVSFGRVNQ